jgi:hypothetical protein
MNQNTGRWDILPDMPHETTMDRLRLNFDDLSAAVQREIRLFDIEYQSALQDGFLSDDEFRSLTTKSSEIAKKIEIERSGANADSDAGTGTAVAVVLVGVLAIFGLNKLFQS